MNTRSVVILTWGCILTIVVASCSTMSSSAPEKIDDWLKADYQQMKKRLILLERENSVLSDENDQLKTQNRSHVERIEQLDKDLSALKKQYQEEIEKLTAEVARLAQEKETLETESFHRIQELEHLSRESAARYEQEINGCKAQLSQERGQWEEERKVLKQELTEKESNCSRRIHELTSDLAAKEATVSALHKQYSEQAEKLQKTQTALEAKTREIERLKEEVNQLRSATEAGRTIPGRATQGTGQ